MGAPATEELRELERLLVVAAESGEPLTRAMVQEEFSCGAGDADEMLAVLSEHGKAVEVAPGEWAGPSASDLAEAARAAAEPPRVEVDVPDDEGGEESVAERRARLAERLDARRLGATGERVAVVAGEPTVRLTMAIAEALDAEAIGKIVKAAIAGAEDGEIFVLEVTP